MYQVRNIKNDIYRQLIKLHHTKWPSNAKCIKSHSVEMINSNSKNLIKGKKSRKYYIWIWTGFRHKNSTRVAKTSDAAATYQFLQIP